MSSEKLEEFEEVIEKIERFIVNVKQFKELLKNEPHYGRSLFIEENSNGIEKVNKSIKDSKSLIYEELLRKIEGLFNYKDVLQSFIKKNEHLFNIVIKLTNSNFIKYNLTKR